jgi:hypothetical protein
MLRDLLHSWTENQAILFDWKKPLARHSIGNNTTTKRRITNVLAFGDVPVSSTEKKKGE